MTIRNSPIAAVVSIVALIHCSVGFAGLPASQPAIERRVYKEVGDTALELFIHTPVGEAPDGGWPTVIFFFGGGWSSGTVEQFTPHAEHFARRGMVAVRADYRVKRRHDVTPFDCMADARSAIRWVRANAENLSVDPEQIAAAGGSAGGHIALSTATIAAEPAATDPDVSCVPDALALFNPVTDVEAIGERFVERFEGRPRDASPMAHLKPGLPPTLILHGSADTTVPIDAIKAFSDKAIRNGDRCELITFQGRGHGFFNHKRNKEDFQAALDKVDTFFTSLNWIDPMAPPVGDPSIFRP